MAQQHRMFVSVAVSLSPVIAALQLSFWEVDETKSQRNQAAEDRRRLAVPSTWFRRVSQVQDLQLALSNPGTRHAYLAFLSPAVSRPLA